MGSKKYHNADWLREKYHGENLTLKEVGDLCSVSTWTIGNWMDKHGIERRGRREAQLPEGKHTEREWLAEQYHGKGRSLKDIAGECDVDAVTIMNWMERHDIPRRGPSEHKREEKVTYSVGSRGYRFVQTRDPDGTKRKVYIHQLLAIAEGADAERVFSDGEYQVHHDNGFKFDNRPENIEVLSQREHDELHAAERDRAATGEFL